MIAFALGTLACDDAGSHDGSGGAGGSAGAAGSAATGGTGGAAGPWGCVGKVVYPPAPAPTLDIWLRFYHAPAPHDPASFAPFAGASIDACAKDSDCSTPLASSLTNPQGDANLSLPTVGVGFEGFLRAHSSAIVTTDLQFFPPIADASNRFLNADWQPILFLPSAWESFAKAFAGTSIDPTRGHVITTTIDCQGAFTPAVVVTVNGAAPAFAGQGDSVFFNLPPGPVEVKGALGDGTLVAQLSSQVTAGRITALHFGPTELP